MLHLKNILLLFSLIITEFDVKSSNMQSILNLPVEILLFVFESLDDIDDSLHLARCCKYIYWVFNDEHNRLTIFRSIVVCIHFD
jgi:hypothetical protein